MIFRNCSYVSLHCGTRALKMDSVETWYTFYIIFMCMKTLRTTVERCFFVLFAFSTSYHKNGTYRFMPIEAMSTCCASHQVLDAHALCHFSTCKTAPAKRDVNWQHVQQGKESLVGCAQSAIVKCDFHVPDQGRINPSNEYMSVVCPAKRGMRQ